MTVYVLERIIDYEGQDILGVYPSLDEANAQVPTVGRYADSLEITPYEIGAPPCDMATRPKPAAIFVWDYQAESWKHK